MPCGKFRFTKFRDTRKDKTAEITIRVKRVTAEIHRGFFVPVGSLGIIPLPLFQQILPLVQQIFCPLIPASLPR